MSHSIHNSFSAHKSFGYTNKPNSECEELYSWRCFFFFLNKRFVRFEFDSRAMNTHAQCTVHTHNGLALSRAPKPHGFERASFEKKYTTPSNVSK